MNRRRFALTLLGGLGGIRWARGLAAQQPARDSSDRLYDPSAVQSRAIVTAADNDPTVRALEHRLKCTCGCNLDIYTCRTTDFTCSYSPALHREVLDLLQSGRSPEQVVAAFTAKYGERILMAPKPEGFNLAGYLVPGFLLVAVGGALAAVLLRRSRRPPPIPPVPEGTLPNAAGDARLQQALAEVED